MKSFFFLPTTTSQPSLRIVLKPYGQTHKLNITTKKTCKTRTTTTTTTSCLFIFNLYNEKRNIWLNRLALDILDSKEIKSKN